MIEEDIGVPPQDAGFSMPSLPNPFGSSSSSTAAQDPGSSGQSAIKNVFNQPIPLWAQKFVLSGLFPFGFFQPLLANVPVLGNIYTIFHATIGNFFNTLGMNGANLLVSGSMAWAAAKFGSNFLCQGAYTLIASANPGQWWLPYLKSFLYFANPWFTFDIVQSYNPNFREEGYKIPFVGMFLNSKISTNQTIVEWNKGQRVNKQIGKEVSPDYPKRLGAALTKNDIGFVPSTVDVSGNTILDENGNPVLQKDANGLFAYTYGYMTAILFGLMIPYLLLWYMQFIVLMPPAIQAQIDPFFGWGITVLGAVMGLVGTFAAGTFLAAPAAFSQLTKLLPSPQGGGGQKAGAKFPAFNEAINTAMDSTPTKPPVLEGGGGQDVDESIMFLGSLAIASLAGISLALIRSKKVSPVAAE